MASNKKNVLYNTFSNDLKYVLMSFYIMIKSTVTLCHHFRVFPNQNRASAHKNRVPAHKNRMCVYIQLQYCLGNFFQNFFTFPTIT
eukprot:UN02396